MTANTIQDRRLFAQRLLSDMADMPESERPDALRFLASGALGFAAVSDSLIAVENDRLPKTAAIIGELANEFGPDYLAVHFDLSSLDGAGRRGYVALPQVQAANDVIQRYAGDERYPLLIFTLPNGGGIQFATGNPTPGNRHRLQDVVRVSAYWNSANRTALDCLDQTGAAIAAGGVPQRAFRNAFNVQPVTEAFFADYKAAYDSAVASLSATAERTDAESFVQTLFNRLLFIHFVSRKGWLSFNGDADYLNALWKDYVANPNPPSGEQDPNFYTDRLRPLFFGGLNNPQSRDATSYDVSRAIFGDVPFLNGGLFEKSELDSLFDDAVPDDAITPLIGDLFNSYNFTVMESTPLDTEVAVDPEMLGKLFEETVNERHSNGAYYTPRPVVAFMCREAIKGYLAGKGIKGLDDDSIAKLVDGADPDAINVAQALDIANAVAEMKVVDPACGSGAFLLGMLQEILALNETLFRAGHTPESLYRQKLDIISNNIYGADKDGLAVNTAMLRLWLSLAVDYDGDGAPDPLPNLDMKLVAGDAIAGPDPQRLDLTLASIVNSGLRENIAAYTTAQGPRKLELKNRVDEIKAQLRDQLQDAAPSNVVEWRIDFADVMLNGGFDVAIANPPYVRHEGITPKSYKNALVKQYADAASARSDLYCYFYARALQLLRDGGMHLFVCSNSWLDVGYGAKLQEYLLNNARVRAIYESAIERQFSTAQINTMISALEKTTGDDSAETRFVSLRDQFETALANPSARREIVKTRAELMESGLGSPTARGRRRYVGDKWGGKYLRAPDIYHRIQDKYSDKLVRLGDIAAVKRGITTGANAFFYLTPERIAEFGIEPEYCKPVMTSPQESRRIAVDPATLPKRLFMCRENKDALTGTGALAYIEWGEGQGYHRRSSVKSRRRWYDLGQRNTTRLAMNYLIGTTARAFFTENGLLFGDNFQELRGNTVSPTQLCTTLNSTLSQLMFNISGRANFGGGLMKIQTFEIEDLQIVNPQLLFEVNAKLFASRDWDVLNPSPERWQVDGLVFDALGLTPAEREAVHEGVTEMVANRLNRAKSVSNGAPKATDAGRSDAVADSMNARGKSIYEEKIRPKVGDAERGKFAVIDIYSGDYEIDSDLIAAIDRIDARHPGAFTYTMRVGHRAAFKTGLRSKVRAS